MKSKRTELLLGWMLFVAASIIRAQEFPPDGFTEVRREKSPRETFQIVHFQKDPADPESKRQIWIQWIRTSDAPQLLDEYGYEDTCLVSDDEKFIAVNRHVMAEWDVLEIFENRDGLFDDNQLDLTTIVLKALTKQLKLKKAPGFDGTHLYADAWLPDDLMLCHFQASLPGFNNLHPWYFIYDVKKHELLLDFSKINRSAFSVEKQSN